ncbi:hypothetical protein [Streptomyces chartreusis]|uniref:hypothetical protein n=1 Tax=Streptomyces chartreusis TaxID=1969 RepID=UPI002E192EEA
MTDRSTGPRCGNNPNYRMSDGDRQAVDDFKAYLAGRAALRDRIAEALYAHDHPSHLVPLNETGMGPAYRESADAVLPVLLPPADRAAVLREAATRYEEILANANTGQDPRYWTAVRDITLGLRRLTAETPQPETQDAFVPPAAEGLPLAALDSATEGANRLDAWARDPRGRNFLAHALVQLARDGWLRREVGAGFEPGCICTEDAWPPHCPCRADEQPAVVQAEGEAESTPRTVCVCGHTRAEHLTVSGRLLCDACDPDSTDNLTCRGFEAL